MSPAEVPVADRPAAVAAAVDQRRLGELVSRLATFGALPGGGLDRQALTEPDLAARRFLTDLARSYGAEAARDPAGNLFFRWAGTTDADPVVTGSHVDSQPSGGTLDGAYGVCAAIEVLAALSSTGIHARRPIEAVIWTNEEGSRFSPGTAGSTAFVRPAVLDEFRAACDLDGVTFADALAALDARLPDVPSRELARPIHAFVEAHIEQGPLMEDRGVPVGVVRSVQGTRWFEFRVAGLGGHAGTTPLSRKRDALMAAVQVADGVYRILRASDDTMRLTIGRLIVHPGSINVVPAEVVFTVDLRHPDLAVLDDIERRLRALAVPTAGCEVGVERIMIMPPTAFDPGVVGAVQAAVDALGVPHMGIDSGAFHDALRLVEHCPTGMVFVPSIGGHSHSPLERTDLADMTTGARVLAHAVLALADQEGDAR